VGHQEQRPLEPLPLHELVQRFPQEGLEHAVKVERGEAGCLGHLRQSQRMSEVAHYVIDRAVDALDVVHGDGALGFSVSSQDLASGFCGSRASYTAGDLLSLLVSRLSLEGLRENRVKVRTLLIVGAMALIDMVGASTAQSTRVAENKTLELGNFSVSLTVKDIKASMAFYQKLDFKQVGGKVEQNWVVLQNGTARIGLFQGMFDKNILTFNPGWTKDKETLTEFQDVRELQRALKARGLTMAPEADVTTQGPAFFEVTDPDGNTLLFDQHVPSPKR
jgi:catechol 2,3-dioxygenase-like lactoylglutathione lyase family enzyme